MSSVTLEKTNYLTTLKHEAQEGRRENNRLIEGRRQDEIQKKQQVRNRIHNDILESRVSIQQFYKHKHQAILDNNRQEIYTINGKRKREEAETLKQTISHISPLEKEVRSLRKVAD